MGISIQLSPAWVTRLFSPPSSCWQSLWQRAEGKATLLATTGRTSATAPPDYGRPTAPNCHMEQISTFEDRCLPYEETTCYSQNEEDCTEYYVNTCTPIVNTEVDRRCFNVTELICELVESVNYRQVEENFHVQSCYTTKDRICDTVHEIDTTTKDDLQCIELETPNC